MIPTVFFVLFALLSCTAARLHLQRRGLPGAVYTCDAPEFRGNCQWSQPSDRCIIVSGIMSIGPDPDGTCILYGKFDCTGQEVQTVVFPGLTGNLPTFAAFRCTPNQQSRAEVQEDLSLEGIDPFADPRLAGGMGSAERKQNLAEIKQMEQDGFAEGLIGLKKGVYY